MSESVHAVVAKPSSHSDHHHRGSSSSSSFTANHHQPTPKILPPSPLATQTLSRQQPKSVNEEEDDDDDIDIIGKCSTSIQHHHHPHHTNTIPFIMTNHTIRGESNYSLFTPTMPSVPITTTDYRINSADDKRKNMATNNHVEKNDKNDNVFHQTSTSSSSSTNKYENENEPNNDVDNSNDEWNTDSNLIPARERLRRALAYYFMSPIDKWRVKGRFPWKLLFQLIKIVLVTTQVIMFGNSVTDYKSGDNSMLVSLHNLLLLNWSSDRDYQIVPPETGPYAVYTKDNVYEHLDYAIKKYANVSALTVGSFGYQLKRDHHSSSSSEPTTLNIEACYHRYANVTLNPSLAEYSIDSKSIIQCLPIDPPYPAGSPNWTQFSFRDFIRSRDERQDDFESLIHLRLNLPLRAILLNTLTALNTPQCFDLDVTINFDNRAHSGEILIKMIIHSKQIDCIGNLEDHSKEVHAHNIHLSVNIAVLILSIISLLLCIRSLVRGQQLRQRTSRFFALAYRRHLETQSSLHFIDGWILMILLNDCLLITGSTINILRQFWAIGSRHVSLRPVDFDNLCSALLGVANLLVWCGVLRYLAFFSKYNVLIVTLKHALTRVLRFLLCVLVLYCGFCFSGWIILGPYHWKFQTLARTSECLFALMNGDDVFATFAYLQQSSSFVWWFSRLYLYTFVLLFIYVVLSLFIAILMDSYETIKEFYVCQSKRKHSSIGVDWLSFTDNQLARFVSCGGSRLLPNSPNSDSWDTLSNYRISLLHDEEMESYNNEQHERNRQSRRQSNGSYYNSNTNYSNGNCQCCLCCCLPFFTKPFIWLANFIAPLFIHHHQYYRHPASSATAASEDEIGTQPIN